MIGQRFWTLGTLLSPSYSVPDDPSMEKEPSKTSNLVMREHEEENLCLIVMTSKGRKQEF